ncbi:MATE family efflux transporter [Corynebacterium sp.]|uniref:MATE family efflux transporter n=1 Tax=Corynebacterium sp. TaxID=1720 RepID=UPI0026DC9AC6|nr:MATE family efflux transporter [Corynebacterium sp.]MDO5075752.1 MATE family efflux transporter [Corynebacterium sp.]
MNFRTVLGLALPALGVLAATPLYLLLDTAVVGRLGANQLAALGAATTIQAQVTTQLTFLSYGTTARSARAFGANDRAGAVREGVQATWVALVVGVALAAIIMVFAPTLTLWLAGDAVVAAAATRWSRVAALGIPLVLLIMAGNGWLRGLQNTRLPLWFTLAGVIPSAIAVPVAVSRFGLVGSAWANLFGELITAALFFGALVRAHEGSWRPQWSIIAQQLKLGKDLIARSLSFQVAFVSAAAVAARFGAPSLAAHQVLLQLWNLLTLVLDSLAIAAQTLVGSALGAATGAAQVRNVANRITLYSTVFAIFLAVVLASGFWWLPQVFTNSVEVQRVIAGPWWIMVAMVVIGGVVFALDGVLLGAADAAFLRKATMGAVLFGFLPGVWLSLLFDAGVVGVWCGLAVFLCVRLVAVVCRYRGNAWMGINVGDERGSR